MATDHEFEIEIERRRILSNVSAVATNTDPPRWLKTRINTALKRLRKKSVSPHFQSSANSLQSLFRLLSELEKNELTRITYLSLYDHYGRTKIKGQNCYVLEPYKKCAEHDWLCSLDYMVARLSSVLDCSVVWTKTSWWYPEVTYRIVFSEQPIK